MERAAKKAGNLQKNVQKEGKKEVTARAEIVDAAGEVNGPETKVRKFRKSNDKERKEKKNRKQSGGNLYQISLSSSCLSFTPCCCFHVMLNSKLRIWSSPIALDIISLLLFPSLCYIDLASELYKIPSLLYYTYFSQFNVEPTMP